MKLPLWLIAALLSISFAATGQLLLKSGVRGSLIADVVGHPSAILGALTNPYVIGGIAAYATSMVLWMLAISGQQLSSVYPMAALGYVIVTIASVKLFNDTITGWKIAGIALIVIGTIVINAGPQPAPAATVRSDSASR